MAAMATIPGSRIDYSSDDSSTSTSTRTSAKKILKSFSLNGTSLQGTPVLVLEPLNDTFVTKRLDLLEPVKVGRKVNAKVGPEPSNGIFDSKVLSRNHAEIWYEDDKVLIKDVKSSNGTFVNGVRLSDEGQVSAPHELNTGDMIEFGIDIMNDDGQSACQVTVLDGSGVIRQNPDGPKGQVLKPTASLFEEKAIALATKSELEALLSMVEFMETTLGRSLEPDSLSFKDVKPMPPPPVVPTASMEDLEVARSAIAAAESVSEVLKLQLKDAKDEARMWREKWESLRADMVKRKEEAEKGLDALRLENVEVTKSLEADVEAWKLQSEQALAEVEFLKKKELAAIKAATAAASAQRDHLESLELEVKRLKEENAATQGLAEEKTAALESLTREFEDLQQNIARDAKQYGVADDQVNDLKQKLAELEEKVVASNRDKNAVEVKSRETEASFLALSKKNLALEEKLRDMEETLKVSDAGLKEALEKCAAFEEYKREAVTSSPTQGRQRRRPSHNMKSSTSQVAGTDILKDTPIPHSNTIPVRDAHTNVQTVYFVGVVGVVAVSIFLALGYGPR
ncbi:hypothetical protein HDU97_007215 [Phlyctochytrium planicorne]|nr:hypothetical protein HDU97_007215 [Phlyctochytrium planicorne]